MEAIVERIIEFKEELEERECAEERYEVSRKEFTFLLSGIASLRSVPGISEHMGFEEFYHCKSDEEKKVVKEFLAALYDIKDKDSLMKACYVEYFGSEQYKHFMTFWKGAPMFDMSELNQDGLAAFCRCMQLATPFQFIVEEKGFYAWDIGERINLCRIAVVADIITEEEFEEITDNWVRMAQVFYRSYEEFAVSAICGAIYHMACTGDDDLEDYLELNIRLANMLLGEGAPWAASEWYVPEHAEWADIVDENLGCVVSKRVLEHGSVGRIYRDEPIEGLPDSGWRITYGDEEDGFMDKEENMTIVGINQVCNIQPDMLALIYAEVGSEYEKDEDGDWTLVE